MIHNKGLDCVVVGHNDMDFAVVEEALRKTRRYSGAYTDLEANSVRYRDRRIPYMNLLNEVLADVSGRPHDLNECEMPHLGSAYLASFLLKRGCAVEVINLFNKGKGRFAEILEHERPRAVAITTTLYVEHSPIVEVVEFVRRHNPEAKIVVGGPHIFNVCSTQEEASQKFILQAIGADIYIVDSQGELTLSRVLAQLRDGGNLSRVPNLIYTEDQKEFRRTVREIESNGMDENVADWSLFDADYFTPTVQTRTARSCAFKCSFCRYPINAGKLSLTGVDTLEEELRYLAEHGARNLVFIDDTFNVPLPRFKEICRMLTRSGFGFDWYSFFRASNADDETFDLMAESGCKGVFLGIESGDSTILKNMNKHADVGSYKKGIQRLKACDITTFASVIIGFPGETEETHRNTLDFLEETGPTFYRGELYYHYTNVPIHQRAEEFGIRGAGYSWQHRSMDWRRGGELLQETYRSLRGPSVLPGYMFDFWAIPYLTGRGFTLEQIRGFTEVAQEMMVAGFNDAVPDADRFDGRLREVFAEYEGQAGRPTGTSLGSREIETGAHA